MTYETILYETSADRVATVTINRPEAMNSFTVRMLEEFADVWKRIAKDESVNAVVLRAAEGRAFSTGADVKAHSGENVLGTDDLWAQVDPGEKLGAKANRCWKPVVTAVHGLCCAGAFYWLNESDIILCSDDAQFFDPHVTYGLVAAVEPIGLRYRLPLGEVLRMALLGNDERMGAETALRVGLVSEIVARDALWARAHELAAKIATKPTVAVQGTVRAIWESLELPRSAGLNHALRYCLLGNPIAQADLDHQAAMKQARRYEVR